MLELCSILQRSWEKNNQTRKKTLTPWGRLCILCSHVGNAIVGGCELFNEGATLMKLSDSKTFDEAVEKLSDFLVEMENWAKDDPELFEECTTTGERIRVARLALGVVCDEAEGLAYAKKEQFEIWKKEVDEALVARCGMSSEELMDCDYRGYFESAMTPDDTVTEVLICNDAPEEMI